MIELEPQLFVSFSSEVGPIFAIFHLDMEGRFCLEHVCFEVVILHVYAGGITFPL